MGKMNKKGNSMNLNIKDNGFVSLTVTVPYCICVYANELNAKNQFYFFT